MFNSLLRKLILNQSGKSKILVARLGLTIAIFLLLTAIQIQSDYDFLLTNSSNQDSIGDFLVINKVLNNETIGNTVIDSNLLSKIKEQPFTEEIGLLSPSRFKASIQSISDRFPFYTDISFESIPNTFIDIKNIDFSWRPDADFVPVIVPNMFLDIYNFQFSISQNLPQLSPEIVKMIVFKITVYSNKGPVHFNAKIVGFSDRIASMLVPTQFIQWGNQYAGTIEKNAVSRLVIKTKDPSNPAISRFFKENNLDTNDDKLRFSKYRKIIDTVVSIAGFTGLIMLIFSLIIFTLFIQLNIANSKEEIGLLIILGASPFQLSRFLFRRFFPGNLISILASILLVSMLQFILKNLLETQAIFIPAFISISTAITGIFLIMLLWIITARTIKKYIYL